MNQPLRFPSDAEISAEEAARFRVLSPAGRIASIRSVLTAGELLMRRSPRRDHLAAYHHTQEQLARESIKEFVTRHAR